MPLLRRLIRNYGVCVIIASAVLMGALIGMTVDWTARQFIPAILREDAAKLEAAEQADQGEEGEKELGKEIKLYERLGWFTLIFGAAVNYLWVYFFTFFSDDVFSYDPNRQ